MSVLFWIGIFILALPFLYMVGVTMLIEIWPRNKKNAIVTNVREVEVSAQQLGAKGTILVGFQQSVTAIDIATGESREVLKAMPGEAIYSVAGPNKNGLAVVVLNRLLPSKGHRIAVIDFKKEELRELFQRESDPVWDHAVGKNLAIAEATNLVLYFRDGKKIRGSGTREGSLWLIDLDDGTESLVIDKVLELEFAASEDMETIWYTADNGGKPVGHRRHKGTSEPFSQNIKFRWLGKGAPIMAFTEALNETLANPDSGSWESTRWPNYVSDVRRIDTAGWVIGKANQVRVEDVKFDKRSGMSGGPQPMDRIVAVSQQEGKIHTIVRHIDSASCWSYGTFESASSKSLQELSQ